MLSKPLGSQNRSFRLALSDQTLPLSERSRLICGLSPRITKAAKPLLGPFAIREKDSVPGQAWVVFLAHQDMSAKDKVPHESEPETGSLGLNGLRRQILTGA